MYLHNFFYVVNKKLLSKVCIYYFPGSLKANSWIQVWLKRNKMKVQWTREIQCNKKEENCSPSHTTQILRGTRTCCCVVLTGRSVKAIPVKHPKIRVSEFNYVKGLNGKSWTWAKLAPLYSKSHLQHDSDGGSLVKGREIVGRMRKKISPNFLFFFSKETDFKNKLVQN